MEPSREDVIRVASLAWGPPHKGSNAHELRFGTHDSKSLDTEKLVWYDHERKIGGGWVELYRDEAHVPLPQDDTPPKRAPTPPPWERPVAAFYDYADETGVLLFQAVRFGDRLLPRFMQRQPDSKHRDRWIWKITEPQVRLVLYRLPDLLLYPDDAVYILEGEKDVDRAWDCGFVATTNPMGAGKWLPEYAEFLRDRDVAVVPDNDAAGRKHAADIVRSLTGIARSVTMIELPGELPEKGDLSDWFNLGHSPDELTELYRVARIETRPPGPPRMVEDGDQFVAAYETPDYLIDGIVQRGRLYACTSLTNHGKTAVWLYSACMIQNGRPFAGLAVDQDNVLYLAGENPTDLQGRMRGIKRELGLKKLPYVLPRSFPMDEEGLMRLVAELRAMGITWGLIVGDTASSFFPGDDENDNVQAGGYARSLRALCELPGNPAVVMLCHPVKNASRDNLLPRGGGAFLNELDGNLVLWSEQLGETTQLHWQGKIRGPNFDAVNFKYRTVITGLIDKRGRPDNTILAEPIDDFEAGERAKEAEANEDAVLAIINRSPKTSQADIAQICGWIDNDGKPERWRAQRALERLKKDGLIKFFRRKWIVTPEGKKILDEPS